MHRNEIPICSKGSISSAPLTPKKPPPSPPFWEEGGQSSHTQNPTNPPQQAWVRGGAPSSSCGLCRPAVPTAVKSSEGGGCVSPIGCSPPPCTDPSGWGGREVTTTAEWGLLARSGTRAAKALCIPQGGRGRAGAGSPRAFGAWGGEADSGFRRRGGESGSTRRHW